MEVATPWFIDAWAVFDGVAFASRSDPAIRRTDRVTEAETTVFLSVPELEPIPLGRITTGLRAARASFQDGFFDDEGTEIAFGSLDGIREAIRRAYLATGLGPGGAGLPGRPTPAPASDGPTAGGLYFQDATRELELEGNGPPLSLIRGLIEGAPDRLRHAVRVYAEAVLLDWEYSLASSEAAALAELYVELTAAGIWRSGPHRGEFAGLHGLAVGSRYFEHRGSDPAIGPARRFSPQQLIGTAPCPVIPPGRNYSRLSDPMKLSLCDSQYLLDGGLAKAAQILIPALLVGSGSGDLTTFWHGADELLDHRLRQAVAWLDHQLPTTAVPSAADQLLNSFARGWLQEPPDFPDPGGTPAPTDRPGPSTTPPRADPAPVTPAASAVTSSPVTFVAEEEDDRSTEGPIWNLIEDAVYPGWTLVDDPQPPAKIRLHTTDEPPPAAMNA
ncbi:hypothetical protein FB561_4230 [Kribbella amoyensis]|uniref:Uncharacterized protein n=1 Tax=Kribbella amoyensis TaxID=996641 RepID=A0A561BVZ9_9ACTN|nr:hypothetical protein [Kribbella amoyensis]TWD83075.1 hypothetical protein FB561_4230 [Kribbella amoyensis]